MDSLFSFSETQPGKTAFFEAETGFGQTYSELASAVLRAAGAIMSATGGDVGPGGDLPVAVLTDRSPLAVAAFLGAAAAGRWYAAIDAELPPERLKLMTALCRPAALINASSLPDGGFSDICEENGCSYIPRDVWTSAAEACLRDLTGRPAESAMFGIFTSGSTGTPKLVVKSRAAME
ncbi:MAG: AMP-binding protein, partial [Clostridiales bacterium]|nr:AMP-binding protein [Clostridiales bacterium]